MVDAKATTAWQLGSGGYSQPILPLSQDFQRVSRQARTADTIFAGVAGIGKQSLEQLGLKGRHNLEKRQSVPALRAYSTHFVRAGGPEHPLPLGVSRRSTARSIGISEGPRAVPTTMRADRFNYDVPISLLNFFLA